MAMFDCTGIQQMFLGSHFPLLPLCEGDGDVDVSVVMPVWIFGGNVAKV